MLGPDISPDISNVIRDPERGVTWVIMAYRKLTKEEMIAQVGHALSRMKKRDRPKPGMRVTLITVIGA